MASTEWTGITVRNTAKETGTVPRSASSQSPDIVVSGKEPMSEPQILEKQENYGNSYSNELFIGLPNYMYIRGKNYTDTKMDGVWTLYWATPNILLYPFLWEQNQLATSAGNKRPPFSIDGGAIGATLDAFTWVPADTQDHYCLIAIAETAEHGNPLKGVSNITSLAETLANNANIAQRNLKLVRSPGLPQVVSSAYYNQGSEGATMDLVFVFTNMPAGSAYTVSSGTPLNGEIISYKGDNTVDPGFKVGPVDVYVPENWSTLFTYTMTFGSDWSRVPDGKVPTMEVRGEIVMGQDHPLYHLGTDCPTHPITGAKRACPKGGPVRVLIAGSVSIECDVRT